MKTIYHYFILVIAIMLVLFLFTSNIIFVGYVSTYLLITKYCRKAGFVESIKFYHE